MEHFLECSREMTSIRGDKRVIPGYQWIIPFLVCKAEQRFAEISIQSPHTSQELSVHYFFIHGQSCRVMHRHALRLLQIKWDFPVIGNVSKYVHTVYHLPCCLVGPPTTCTDLWPWLLAMREIGDGLYNCHPYHLLDLCFHPKNKAIGLNPLKGIFLEKNPKDVEPFLW